MNVDNKIGFLQLIAPSQSLFAILDCQVRSFKLAVKDIKSNWWLALDLQNSLETLEEKIHAKIEKIGRVQKEIHELAEAVRDAWGLKEALDRQGDQSIDTLLQSRVQKAMELAEKTAGLKE